MKNIELEPHIAKEILEKNSLRENNTFSKYACLSRNAVRIRDERTPDNQNIRQPFFHDTDKIIHSLAYTRYIDKTQVFYLFDNDHITHRVLHVQLVSKIARVIGRCLSLNEDLIEAISLAHDLGHVPYGHDGERKLNELAVKEGNEYFCHNAQSVRALTYLEGKGQGLNLTVQVLDGILCHNGELLLESYRPEYSKTIEKFKQEYERCWTVDRFSKNITAMTLEGCVMRISDFIAYIGRDFEDAITLELIQRDDLPATVANTLGDNNSAIINNLILDLINNSYGKDYIELSSEVFKAISDFYAFSKVAIYQNPRKSTEDEKIKSMFDVLFDKYLKDLVSERNETSISKYYLDQMTEEYKLTTPHFRIVCDYIAGMTDKFFNTQFKETVIPKSFGYKLNS